MATSTTQRVVETALRHLGGRTTGQRQLACSNLVSVASHKNVCIRSSTRQVSGSCMLAGPARGAIEVFADAVVPAVDAVGPATAGGASLATRKKPLNGYLNKVLWCYLAAAT